MFKHLTKDDFVNFSGGAYGGDTIGDQIGRQNGFTNHMHYRPYDNTNVSASLRRAGVKGVILSREDTDHGRNSVNSALGRNFKDNISGNLQGRNFYQVDNSDTIICIGTMSSTSSISGGTNTAFQLAIVQNKNLFLWDLITQKWYGYSFEESRLLPCSTPVLTPHYSIVGTRDIEDYNIKDKSSGQWVSRPQYVGKEKADNAYKAIQNVFRKTSHLIS